MAKQKKAWDKLTMLEKALLIRLSVESGISDLKLIRDTYNLYSDGGSIGHKKSGKEQGESSYIQKLDNTNVYTLPIIDPILVPEDMRLSDEELAKFNHTKALYENEGLKIVSPEFDLLTLARSFVTLPFKTTTVAKPQAGNVVTKPISPAERLGIPKGERNAYLIGSNADPSYFAAIGLNNPKYTQALRDYHFMEKVGLNGVNENGLITFFHGSPSLTLTHIKSPGIKAGGRTTNGLGYYATTSKNYALRYTLEHLLKGGKKGKVYELYIDSLNPYIFGKDVLLGLQPITDITSPTQYSMLKYWNNGYLDLYYPYKMGNKGSEYVVFNPNQWKLKDAITFGDDGNIIPLSLRDNTLINDIRFSTGGPLYPFSFEKNPFLKTPVVRYDDGGFFSRLFKKKETPPTPEEIKAARVDRFMEDIWETEYSVPKGYDPVTGLYFPYDSPEGGTKTIGPGFKLREDGSGDATMFTAKEAARGVTREQINEKLRAQGELQYDKVLEFLNQKGNRLPIDTINPNIMNGLMDLRFLVGALGGWNNLREAVLNGDLEGIKKESKATFKDENTGKIKVDTRRNDLRAEKFWHYD